jgi:hypothetical protein
MIGVRQPIQLLHVAEFGLESKSAQWNIETVGAIWSS